MPDSDVDVDVDAECKGCSMLKLLFEGRCSDSSFTCFVVEIGNFQGDLGLKTNSAVGNHFNVIYRICSVLYASFAY